MPEAEDADRWEYSFFTGKRENGGNHCDNISACEIF